MKMLKKGVLIAVLPIAGCLTDSGDGGGGNLEYSGSTEPVAIDTTNSEAVVAVALESISGEMLSEGMDFGFMKPGETAVKGDAFRRLVSLLPDPRDRIVQQKTGVLAGVTESDSEECPNGGSASYTISYADPYGFTAGDSASMSFDNCDVGNGLVMDGRVSMSVDTADYNSDGSYTETITFSFTRFAMITDEQTLTMDGGFTNSDSEAADWSWSSLTKGDSFVVQLADATGTITEEGWLTDFEFRSSGDWSTMSYGADYTMASTTLGGSITVDTITDFTSDGYGYPNSGQMVVTGANNAKVRLTAVDDTYVTLEYDLDGDGDYDPPETLMWSELGAEAY